MARRRTKAAGGFEDWHVQFLLTGEVPSFEQAAERDINEFELIEWHGHDSARQDVFVKPAWEALRGDLLPAWIQRHPGTRPFGWWAYDAPEPRQRLGGTGTPVAETLAYKPTFRFGLPAAWFTEILSKWFPDKGVPPDPNDPPLYESEAAYLERHNLLTDAEREELPRNAFDPVKFNLENER